MNLFVVEALRWTDEDERVLDELQAASGLPIVLLINKVDRAQPKERLLPFIQELTRKAEFAEVVPISALRARHLERLPGRDREATCRSRRASIPPEQVTDFSRPLHGRGDSSARS